MNIEIITPDKTIFEGEINSVRVPGKKGSFQVLKDHAPVVSTLEEGTITVVGPGGDVTSFDVSGGVVEVRKNRIILLVESVI
ncbi:MAG: ATP synthase F1 subunit epsilon [Bacteroidales bacterium]|nr:ATP synthase F1 subunit epsilon [Bacteroidales bacterium]